MNGLLFKAARKKCGLTQAELAEQAGISRSHYAAIEQGYYNPSLKTLKRIAFALGIAPSALLDNEATTDQPVVEDGKAASIGQRIRSRRCEQSMTLEAICPCCGARMTLKPWRDA